MLKINYEMLFIGKNKKHLSNNINIYKLTLKEKGKRNKMKKCKIFLKK